MPPELSGPWACDAGYLRGLAASAPASYVAAGIGGGTFQLAAGGVAVINLVGPLTKAGGWWFGGTSTVRARQQLAEAVASDAVKSIALYIDSPGGTAAGTKELADQIRQAATVKAVHAHIQDVGASAAYWLAASASKVFANPTALVGSIGTYSILYDSSGLAEKVGVKVHVVRAGAMKGAGAPGTPITDEILADAQRIIDGINQFFLEGVRSGRRLSAAQVAKLADGRVHLAAKAADLRLIDGVQSWEATVSQLAAGKGNTITAGPAGSTTRNRQMDQTEAIEQFNEAVSSFLEKNPGRPKSEAVLAVARKQPELHAAYLQATNTASDKQRRRGF